MDKYSTHAERETVISVEIVIRDGVMGTELQFLCAAHCCISSCECTKLRFLQRELGC